MSAPAITPRPELVEVFATPQDEWSPAQDLLFAQASHEERHAAALAHLETLPIEEVYRRIAVHDIELVGDDTALAEFFRTAPLGERLFIAEHMPMLLESHKQMIAALGGDSE